MGVKHAMAHIQSLEKIHVTSASDGRLLLVLSQNTYLATQHWHGNLLQVRINTVHILLAVNITRNSHIMACPPVRGDNPRALASGLSYIQVDNKGLLILYHQHQ